VRRGAVGGVEAATLLECVACRRRSGASPLVWPLLDFPDLGGVVVPCRCTSYNFRASHDNGTFPVSTWNGLMFVFGSKWFVDYSIQDRRYATLDCTGSTIGVATRYYDGVTSYSLGTEHLVRGLVTQLIGPYNTYLDYDLIGRVTKQSLANTAASYNITTAPASTYSSIDYNLNVNGAAYGGPVTSITTKNPLGQVTTQAIDPRWGSPTQITEPSGSVTRIFYDGLGRRDRIILPSVVSVDPTSDPNADSYRYSYSIPYNTSGANVDEAAGGVVVSTFQNNNGLAGTNGTYIRTDSFVDGLGRVRDTQTVTPQNRVVSQTFYDSRGLAVKQVGPFGSVTTATPDLVTAPAGAKQTVTAFDELARPTGTTTTGTDPVSGVVSSLSSTTSYDTLLNSRVSTPAPAGAQQTVNSTWTDWDGNLNRVIVPQTTGPNGAVADRITSYTYDVNGSVKSIVDPKGLTTSFNYDVYGRLTDSSDPDKGNTAIYYNVDSVGLSSTTTVDAVAPVSTSRCG
jgi:YD repeat-containing protein